MDVPVDVVLRGLPSPSWLRNHPAVWEGGRAGAFQFTVCFRGRDLQAHNPLSGIGSSNSASAKWASA